MQNYRKSDYAINKNSPNIVYRFHNEIIEITLEDYLKENPDKTEHDFAELKALSDQIYYEQDRAESAQTRKDVSIHGLEETEHCATRALDEEWEERVVDIQNRKYAWKALEQLFTVGALTEVQKRRFRLHIFQGLSIRQIGINFKFKGFWFACMLLSMMLPFQVVMIPQYIIFNKLGWVGSYLPIIVPQWFGQGFFIFLNIQFIKGIPMDLDEAARIGPDVLPIRSSSVSSFL